MRRSLIAAAVSAALVGASLTGCVSQSVACASWAGFGNEPERMAADAEAVIDATVRSGAVGARGVQHYDVRIASVATGDELAAGDRVRIYVPIDECSGDGTLSQMRDFHSGDRVIAYLHRGSDFVFVPNAWHALTPLEGIIAYTDAAWQASHAAAPRTDEPTP